METPSRQFWVVTIAVICVFIAIDNAPMLAGKIPFPVSILSVFPQFAEKAPPDALVPQANIGDIVTAFYPFHSLAARAAREGTIPLWNPYMLSGMPFLANAQSALFYPPNFLYYILPVPVAWSIIWVLRLVLSFLFTTIFVRRLGGSMTGSIVAGILFAFCGFTTAWRGTAMLDTAIWLPLICYAVVNLSSSCTPRAVALTGVAFAMPVLAGHPETALHLTMMGTALACFLGLSRVSRPHLLRFASYFVAAGLLAMGLSAVQLLPTMEWVRYANHSFVDSWGALPLWTIISFVSRDILRAINSVGLEIPEQAAYMGMLMFLAVPLAFFHSSKKFVVFFAGAAIVTISIVYGFGPIYWLTQHVPILKILKNTRMILLASFSLAVLSGLGISALERMTGAEWRQRLSAAVVAAAGFLAAFTMIYMVRMYTELMVEFVRYPRFSIYLLIASAVPVLWKLIGGLREWPFRILTLVVLAADVLTFANGAVQFTHPANVYPRIELFDRLQQPPLPPFRIVQVGLAYPVNTEMMYGQRAVGGFDVLLERVKLLTADFSLNDMAAVTPTSEGILQMKDRRLDMLNAKYVVVAASDPRHNEFRGRPERFRFLFTTAATDVYENLKVLPAAHLVPVSSVETIGDEMGQLSRVKDPAFDAEQNAVFPEAPRAPAASESSSQASQPSPAVEWISQRMNTFELKANAAQASALVVSQIYYPGWKAFIDDEPVPVLPANYALTGIYVPAGEHRIRFSFEPFSFKAGLFLSVSATLVLIVLWGFGFRLRS